MPVPTRILIIEDEAILAANLKSFLSRIAADVRIAADAHATMDTLRDFIPDIVILDFDLPNIHGIEIYAAIIKPRAPGARGILISGHLSERIAREAYEEGIRHILCKPFSFAELQEKLDSIRQEFNLSLPASVPAPQRFQHIRQG